MGRTTRQQVEAQARRLARELGYSTVTVHGGSKVNGVSWHVTLGEGADSHTIRLGFAASESYDTLHAMAEGASLANMRRGA